MIKVVLGVSEPDVFSVVKPEQDRNVSGAKAPIKSRARKTPERLGAASGIAIAQSLLNYTCISNNPPAIRALVILSQSRH